MTVAQRTAIAVAGFLGVGRAVAAEAGADRKIVVGEQLREELNRIVGIALENKLERVPGKIPVIVPPAGTGSVNSILTLEDIQGIPDEALNVPATLNEAMVLACNLINHSDEWVTFVKIAETLIELAPNPIENLAGLLGLGQNPGQNP